MAVIIAIVIALLAGFVGLAVDLGQVFTANTEHQSHADAVVLAGASQLDGEPDAIARATAAIQNNLVQNIQSADGRADLSILSIRFLSSLPDDDQPITAAFETADSTLAECVEVTTTQADVNNLFINAVGGPDTSAVNAVSTACLSTAICDIPPMAFCNPIPPGGDPCTGQIGLTPGQQIRAKFQGPGANWTPGGMGYLQPPDPLNHGAQNIAKNIAGAFSSFGCVKTTVDIEPGQVASALRGMNVRMDLYEPPFATGWRNNWNFRPARNVTKGYMPETGNACSGIPDASVPAVAMGFPRDNNIAADPVERFGNSDWNRAGYWDFNHPGVLWPGALDPNSASRYQVYRYEIDNNLIPDNSVIGGEDGNPQCSTAAAAATDIPDRRTMILGVINCSCGAPINGLSVDVPVVGFIKTFMTEPVNDPGTGMEYLFEFIEEIGEGNDDGVLHTIVQIYR